jgi:hypothetical protein
VIPGSVAEQVLYEIGDPRSYILPDVVADFAHVKLVQAGRHRVEVSGARGRRPTHRYKVSATYQDGFRAVASVSIVGPDAVPKAERTAQALLARARLAFQEKGLPDFSATQVEVLGGESSYGQESRTRSSREVLLRLVVVHSDPACIDLFARELGSVGISFAPGTTGIYGGRPKAVPLIRLFTFFVDKEWLSAPLIWLNELEAAIECPVPGGYPHAEPEPDTPVSAADEDDGELIGVPLIRLAYARSGDKGDTANIAIIARDPKLFPVLRREITSERIAQHFRHLVAGPVQRFEAPGICALNFLLQEALGGGGMASLRIDPQGKAYAAMALEMTVRVPAHLLLQIEAPAAAG